MSRTHHPKQFLRLTGDYSLLQNTLRRLEGLPNRGTTIAVANEHHRFLLAEQLHELGSRADILLEPAPRNTAPAVAAAAVHALSQGAGQAAAMLLVLPSDHVIADVEAFQLAIERAMPHAQAGRLVTFGIVPTRPETGYGYIRRGTPVEGGFVLDRFVEKPDVETARRYLAAGDYFWNSGMFLFRADSYLDALARLQPAMREAANAAVAKARRDLDFIRLDADSFAASPADSIDYAVMEKTDNGVVIPLDAGWNDIGAWDALVDTTTRDAAGNTLRGDVLTLDTQNSLVYSEGRLVTTVGVRNLVVVATPDALLVADKSSAQSVKQIVETLKAQDRIETEFQHVVHRPWGSFEGLAQGPRYQVKRILVKPGASISLQLHNHRAEHWVVPESVFICHRSNTTC
ncbi:MAG: mannose-1-phosphate guanylyltransferase/mannose-6-phosphate isomerase [Pseudomonadota bacterium]